MTILYYTTYTCTHTHTPQHTWAAECFCRLEMCCLKVSHRRRSSVVLSYVLLINPKGGPINPTVPFNQTRPYNARIDTAKLSQRNDSQHKHKTSSSKSTETKVMSPPDAPRSPHCSLLSVVVFDHISCRVHYSTLHYITSQPARCRLSLSHDAEPGNKRCATHVQHNTTQYNAVGQGGPRDYIHTYLQ